MLTLPSRLALPLLVLLPFAGSAWAECDVRKLPQPDTASVEAAARKATGGKFPDIHVQQACLTGTTTSVTLVSMSHVGERWEMTCIRQQSTWYKRGGWSCDEPTRRRPSAR